MELRGAGSMGFALSFEGIFPHVAVSPVCHILSTDLIIMDVMMLLVCSAIYMSVALNLVRNGGRGAELGCSDAESDD